MVEQINITGAEIQEPTHGPEEHVGSLQLDQK